MSAKVHADDKYIVRTPFIEWDAYTDIRNMLKYFDLKAMSESINIASPLLLKFEEVYLYTNAAKAKLTSPNHKIIAFHPNFLYNNIDFKEKVDLFIHSFSLLWVKEEENRKTKSFKNYIRDAKRNRRTKPRFQNYV